MDPLVIIMRFHSRLDEAPKFINRPRCFPEALIGSRFEYIERGEADPSFDLNYNFLIYKKIGNEIFF